MRKNSFSLTLLKGKLFWFAFFILLVSCGEETYTPKPKGYPRVHLPVQKGYLKFENNGPFSFEYPSYAKVIADSIFFSAKPENPWWVNIYFPDLNAKIHLSYKAINKDKTTFYKLVDETYQLSFKHSVKAESIDKTGFHGGKNVSGQMFFITGNAASANQFYITDSINHFVRGSLYFYCEPNEDSLAPATKFIFKDIEHLISTFKWK